MVGGEWRGGGRGAGWGGLRAPLCIACLEEIGGGRCVRLEEARVCSSSPAPTQVSAASLRPSAPLFWWSGGGGGKGDEELLPRGKVERRVRAEACRPAVLSEEAGTEVAALLARSLAFGAVGSPSGTLQSG